MVIFDSNVIIDIATKDANWWQWALSVRDEADLLGGAAINDVIFAEVCYRYDTIEEVDDLMGLLDLPIIEMPRGALFMASQAYKQYRAAGGSRTTILPDFFIGAQARTLGAMVATRDPRPYRTYFPGLELITP